MSGWIKIHRKITENPLYFSEPFNRSMAWIDMILLANHSDNYFFKRGIRVEVKIGQIGYDIESLAKRWQWSRGKVERFMQMLENDKQIVRQKTNVTTLISIVNYKEYQQDSKADNKPNGKPNDKANGHKQELKELKEEKRTIEIRKQEFATALHPFLDTYGKDMLNEFFLYWTEPNQRKTEMKWELEKTWSIERRLATWSKKSLEFGGAISKAEKPKFNPYG